MSLEIGDAISNGFEKLTTTAGLQLAAIFIALSLVTTLGVNSVTGSLGPAAGPRPILALPIGIVGGGVLLVLGFFASLVLTLVVTRTVAHRPSELTSIPADATRSLVRGAVFLFIAQVIVGILVLFGLVLLVIPGIFLAVSLAFAQVFVAVEDEGPLQAISSSWALAKGNRLSIFLLLLVLLVLGIGIAMVGAVAGFISPLLSTLLSLLVSPFLNIFSTAVIVEGYLQLTRESNRGGREGTTTTAPA